MQKYIALLLIISSAPAAAQSAAKAATPQDPNKLVCKSEETLGTRLGSHKVCKTAAEWAAEAEANRSAVEDIRTQAAGLNPPEPPTPIDISPR